MPNVRTSWIGQKSTKGLKLVIMKEICLAIGSGRTLHAPVAASCIYGTQNASKSNHLKILIFLKLYTDRKQNQNAKYN